MTNVKYAWIVSESINKHGHGIFATKGSFFITRDSGSSSSNRITLLVDFYKFLGHENYDDNYRRIMLKVDNEKIINIRGDNSKDKKTVYLNLGGSNDGQITKLLEQMKDGSKLMVRAYDFENNEITYTFSLIGFTKNFRKLKYEKGIKIGQIFVKGAEIIFLPNGDKYEGEFKNEKFHGQGKYSFSNGNIYEGKFKDGKSYGLGSFTLPDGDTFEGYFKDGKPWNVISYDKNGNIKGKYVNGEWIKQ